MIQYAVAHGRPDWSRFWDEIPDADYRAIQALRRIEVVGHERDDWRAAVTAFASSVGGECDATKRFEQLLALIQNREPDEETVTGRQAIEMIRGVHR